MDGDNMHKRVLWITRTAVLIALLVVLQAATRLLGNQILTGSVVNMMLIISIMTCGYATGLPVAILSPVIATLLGIGPSWLIVPFIAAGNTTLVLLWHMIGNRELGNEYVAYIAALIIATAAKFVVLYAGIILVAIPYILNVSEQQAAVITSTYSFQQLITASVGGLCAIILLPTLKKAFKSQQ